MVRRFACALLLAVLLAAVWLPFVGDAKDHVSLPSYVVLRKVVIGGDRFDVTAVRGYLGPRGRTYPCFGLIPPTGPPVLGGSGFGCGLPIYSGPTQGTGPHQKDVLLIAFTGPVQRVQLDLGQRGTLGLSLRLLSKRQARKARLERFRFAVADIPGSFCLHRVTGYDSQGLANYLAVDHHERCLPDTYGIPQPGSTG